MCVCVCLSVCLYLCLSIVHLHVCMCVYVYYVCTLLYVSVCVCFWHIGHLYDHRLICCTHRNRATCSRQEVTQQLVLFEKDIACELSHVQCCIAFNVLPPVMSLDIIISETLIGTYQKLCTLLLCTLAWQQLLANLVVQKWYLGSLNTSLPKPHNKQFTQPPEFVLYSIMLALCRQSAVFFK